MPRQAALPRSFRTPLVPLVPLIGIAFSVWLIANLDWITWVRFAVWMVLGLIVYAFYGYRNSAENVRGLTGEGAAHDSA
jgi:APA family basic amino acid/polyamine antiporter